MSTTIKKISWLIHDSGMSQKDIAKETRISKSTISRMKDGSRPVENITLKNAIKLEELAKRKHRK